MSYSQDLRERVVGFIGEGGSKTEAAKRFSVSRAVIYIWLKSESQSPQKTGPKGHRKLDSKKLKQLIEETPDAYLDELAAELNVSAFTIAYGLKRLGISRKKTTLYVEKIEAERSKFQQVLETLNPADLVYVDECGLQESLNREYARSLIGERCLTDIPGKREARTSIIAGLNRGVAVAPMMFEGYCNTEVVRG